MNFKTKFTKNKGITLIALVVTIIVLLILAGVSIATLTGENGILKRAAEAKEKTETAQKEEEKTLEKLERYVNNYGNNYEIFGDYYQKAVDKLSTLSLEQKINQMLLVSYNSGNVTNAYGGIIFFENNFIGKTEEEVKNMINGLSNTSGIPFLMAVDEEGKTDNEGVIRVSSNSNLTKSNTYLNGTQFQNSKTLYANGGFNLIKKDTIEKSKFLYNLNLNLNLAPVVDMASKEDYIYHRVIGLDVKGTSEFARTVINASKEAKKSGYEVSYCLKHFPGYGSNKDTHLGFSVDKRTYDEVIRDMLPFEEGVDVGAESVLISHNIISSVDSENPASLSPAIHELLRNTVGFKGIIMTDGLNMGALDSIDGNKYEKAVLAGNDILIVSDGSAAFNSIKTAVDNRTISQETIDEAVTRILAWKYYKNML